MKHNSEKILRLIKGSKIFGQERFHYFQEVNSTNSWLLEQDEIGGHICLAETQQFGKGRRGKSWCAPVSEAILISLGWSLHQKNPEGLSLVSGLAVVGALEELGVTGIKLKWPNDLIANSKKLGGILVEISGRQCVIGVGVNVNIPKNFELKTQQPWIDLRSLGFNINRDVLTAKIILQHEKFLSEYNKSGFNSFSDMWNEYHAYKNTAITVQIENENYSAIALGVDKSGALLIEREGVVQRLYSGDISIRPNIS